jgi:hypothetical protein
MNRTHPTTERYRTFSASGFVLDDQYERRIRAAQEAAKELAERIRLAARTPQEKHRDYQRAYMKRHRL